MVQTAAEDWTMVDEVINISSWTISLGRHNGVNMGKYLDITLNIYLVEFFIYFVFRNSIGCYFLGEEE